MASLLVRTAHNSRSWPSAVAGIWKSVGRPLSSNVSECLSYSHEELDGFVPQSPEVSSAADRLADNPLSGEFPLDVRKTETFGADKPGSERSAYPQRARDRFRVSQTPCASTDTILKPQLTRTLLNKKVRAVVNRKTASRSAAKESSDDPRRYGLIGSAFRRGSIHLPSACTTSEAIAILKHRQEQGLYIDSYLIVDILTRCAQHKDLPSTRRVHDYVLQVGLERNPYVATTLSNVYIKCGRLQDAKPVFDGIEKTKRNILTWNVMIGAYARSGRGLEAYKLFLQMRREGFVPDAITYMSLLNASASAGALEWVKEVHGHAVRAGLDSDLRVGNALVHMYGKTGSTDDARLVFDRMKKRDVISWTGMIGAYTESGSGVEAYALFVQMKKEGFVPDALTYMSILNASASAGSLVWVKEVHSHLREAGLESDLRVGNALVHMYAKSGSIDDARLIFDGMKERDVVTFTAMIGGLAQHGCGHEALKLFERVEMNCVKPDGTLFVAVLSACCHTGLVDDGRRLFSAMTQGYGIQPTVVHYNCMVDLLGRAGHLEEAKLLIGNMAMEPDAVTWKALLGACRTYGDVESGEFAAKEVLKLDPKDSAGYVLLSNIYAAAGKWKEMAAVRTMMQERCVRKDPGLSWIEVDNKIHEFVVGDMSHPETKAIYIELRNLTEKMKAEGYIPDTRHVLQNIDEEDKQLALCSHSEKLAIAYGILRVPRGKPIRVFKNLRVCSDCHTASKLISKVTGREIIAKDAQRFHHFKDGACSCGDYW